MNTIKEKYHVRQEEWAILPAPRSEGLLSRGCQPDPRVTLVLDDPRVGRLAYWGGNHWAKVRAVVLVDGQEESLLLEDWASYPWVRVPPDARLVEKAIRQELSCQYATVKPETCPETPMSAFDAESPSLGLKA